MHYSSRKQLGRGIAGALAALIATVGVAFALETLSVAVPDEDVWTATAVIFVDEGGATVYSSRHENEGEDPVEFRIIFDDLADEVSINGGAGVPYAPGQQFTVTATARKVGGEWTVDITVRDALGLPIAVETGASMAGAPTTVTATAQDVIDLTCE